MPSAAQIAIANALPLEVKKDGLAQRQDGSWVIRFRVHPNDMRSELANAPMGTRYQLALVEIADDEMPIEKRKGERHPLVQRAGILCGSQEFQTYIRTEWPLHWEENTGTDTERATAVLRALCGVQSRRDLATNDVASAAFETLTAKFEGWRRGIE